MDIGLQRAVVGRLAVTGDLGYEITVPASGHRALYGALREAGRDLGLSNIGARALDCLRLEKGWGAWGAEYAQSYTPGMSGLDKHIDFDKPGFIGRDAALRERDAGSTQKLVLMAIDAPDADATGFEPIWRGKKRVGFVTSGAYRASRRHEPRARLPRSRCDRKRQIHSRSASSASGGRHASFVSRHSIPRASASGPSGPSRLNRIIAASAFDLGAT